MSEVILIFDKNSPSTVNEEIEIKAVLEGKEEIEYKFLEGTPNERSFSWKKIQDFSNKSKCKWKPKNPGDYMIMVQAKDKISGVVSNEKIRYKINEINEINEKEVIKDLISEEKDLIKDVVMDNTSLILGEKINLEVIPPKDEKVLLYRFWKKGKQGWEPLKDYSIDNKLIYTTTNIGEEEMLIECKRPSSVNNVDAFKTVKFKVKKQPTVEITSFKCLSDKILVGEELIFEVGANYDESRSILYKFLRIDLNGKISCIQDYSTKNIVSISEKEEGSYKILCYARDFFSNKNYDDRAIIMYLVKPYDEIEIKNFTSETSSPQLAGSIVSLKAYANGGKELLYRYIIEGPVAEDSGYVRSEYFNWETKSEGEYKITLKVKDISFDGDYEDKKEISFNIEKKGEKPIKILNVNTSKTRGCIKGEAINLKVKAEGGTELRYSFIIYKDGVEKERKGYGVTNWVNFTPEESGEYEVEVRVIDKFSSREYDAHQHIFFKVKEYEEADIDYVLLKSKEFYLVGDKIELEVISQNTNNIILRYVTKINGYEVEDTDFISNKYINFKPKCPGKYTFEIYAKNILCKEEYDVKKEVSIYVNEAIPVTDTKIEFSKDKILVGEDITFTASSEGGKEVCYEFYIMEKGNWVRVQPYSRKNYYTFLPFSEGTYRVLVLSKSYYKKVNYEDYTSLEFTVWP